MRSSGQKNLLLLENARTAIRAATAFGITDAQRTLLCDLVFENLPYDLTQLEPQALSEQFQYHLPRQNSLLQDENALLNRGVVGILWRIFRALATNH